MDSSSMTKTSNEGKSGTTRLFRRLTATTSRQASASLPLPPRHRCLPMSPQLVCSSDGAGGYSFCRMRSHYWCRQCAFFLSTRHPSLLAVAFEQCLLRNNHLVRSCINIMNVASKTFDPDLEDSGHSSSNDADVNTIMQSGPSMLASLHSSTGMVSLSFMRTDSGPVLIK
jgi:hypothetical protein